MSKGAKFGQVTLLCATWPVNWSDLVVFARTLYQFYVKMDKFRGFLTLSLCLYTENFLLF